MNLIALVILRSLHLILELLRWFGVVVGFSLLEEPDSFLVDREAGFSFIFRVVLSVNNSETHISEDVLIEGDWSDHKTLAKVLVVLELLTSWLSNKEEASMTAFLVPDPVISRGSQS